MHGLFRRRNVIGKNRAKNKNSENSVNVAVPNFYPEVSLKAFPQLDNVNKIKLNFELESIAFFNLLQVNKLQKQESLERLQDFSPSAVSISSSLVTMSLFDVGNFVNAETKAEFKFSRFIDNHINYLCDYPAVYLPLSDSKFVDFLAPYSLVMGDVTPAQISSSLSYDDSYIDEESGIPSEVFYRVGASLLEDALEDVSYVDDKNNDSVFSDLESCLDYSDSEVESFPDESENYISDDELDQQEDVFNEAFRNIAADLLSLLDDESDVHVDQ